MTFLCGHAGCYTLCAVVYDLCGEHSQRDTMIAQLKSLLATATAPNQCNELLYGRSGYLYCLLFVNKYFKQSIIAEHSYIVPVAQAIIKDGEAYANNRKKEHPERNYPPLLWFWHDKEYIGGARMLLCNLVLMYIRWRWWHPVLAHGCAAFVIQASAHANRSNHPMVMEGVLFKSIQPQFPFTAGW